ncbi:helix-turn-helix domain-containing protein [Candidatus Micrarchaeota archaeon]|nr:helix-turn-helix domain-containing protein [Candidatus Micrarchaeota archaeon]
MGILSYRLVSSNIKDQSLKSNEKLLNQFKNTLDSLILNSINDLSLKILQDSRTNPSISYYLSNAIADNIYGMVSVSEYCDTFKSTNPMLFSVGIYFDKNQLLISTEGVRCTLYDKMESQKDLLYYYNLVKRSNGSTSWHVNHNLTEIYPNYYYSSLIPQSVIHMVRKIPGIGNSQHSGGAIIISIDEKVFYNVIKKTAAQDLDKIIICDSIGNIISHTDKEFLGSNITDFSYGKAIFKAADLSGRFTFNINNVPSVVSFCLSDYTDWKYISVTPMLKFNAAASFLFKAILSVALATIFMGVLISLIPALKLSNPIKSLVEFCRGINKDTIHRPQNEYSIIKSTIVNLYSNMKEQEQKFRDVLPVLKDNFLQNLISNQCYDIDRIKDKMQLLEIEFPYSYFCSIVVNIKKLDTQDNALLQEYEKIRVATVLEKIFARDDSMCLHCEKDDNITAVLNFNIDIKKVYELLSSFACPEKGSFTPELYIGIGTVVEDVIRVNQSYAVAAVGLKYCYIFPEKHIISPHDFTSREKSNKLSDKLLINNLCNSLHKHDRDNALGDIDKIISALKSGDFNYSHIMETLAACVSAIKETAAASSIALDSSDTGTESIDRQFEKIGNIIDFREWIRGLVDYVFDCMGNIHSEINRDMVQKAIDYIIRDISNKQLSLKFVAKALYISPSHLSRIFKTETGVTFIDYVTSLKLDYCKDLLLNTSLKIDEISSMMGYSTSQYFISRFKIKYGYTPKEYRCKYASG